MLQWGVVLLHEGIATTLACNQARCNCRFAAATTFVKRAQWHSSAYTLGPNNKCE